MRGARLTTEDKKVVLRICVQDFEVYAHAKQKGKFWEEVQDQLKNETDKDHATLGKAVSRWVTARRRVLKLIKEDKFSGEEYDDRELLIALDEWISLLDSLKIKQKAREDRIGKAGEDTARSKRIQENLGRRWRQKEKAPASQAGDLDSELVDGQPVDEDLQLLSTSPSPSASQSLVHVGSSVSVRRQASTTTASSGRPSQRRAQQQPLPPQPLAEIAAGISGIVAELKADREGAAQAVQEEELSRFNAELKELREFVEARLAAFDRKTNFMLNILLRMEQQQNEEREKGNGVDT
jgi:hypothetical protein